MTTPLVESVTARPGAGLGAHAHSYTGYRLDGFAPGVHRGLPSRYLTFIVALGPRLDLAHQDEQFDVMLAGLHARAAAVRHEGRQAGVEIRLYPSAARALFGVSAAELAGGHGFHLEDVAGSGLASELAERVRSAGSWAARFAVLDDVLRRRVGEVVGGSARAEVDWAWRRLCAADGNVDIGGLAREVGWSRRHLSEQFGKVFGLAPKTVAKVLRFELSRRLVEGGAGMAAVAASAGYYDQAHLYRDWRELAGCTPTTWLEEELPFVQDRAVEREAG